VLRFRLTASGKGVALHICKRPLLRNHRPERKGVELAFLYYWRERVKQGGGRNWREEAGQLCPSYNFWKYKMNACWTE